ncbi:MAG TPA: nicotinate (nicotinamide) nucleotide adenylyltransferase [Rickettsiales bacterium]|nr:nicotinate (nicotinamide) nucleotide adenylyltransferase [Rickettsiales bacterium]
MTSRLRIGLLGGSFNPAHEGHLHISREALKQLKLDQVWWLVSPQNPLKSRTDMSSYEVRLASARSMTRNDPHITVSDFEQKHGLQYTYATLAALKKHYPGTKFVWIMGADNLASFHRWQRWRSIIEMMPIVIFDRAPFSHIALRSKAALAMQRLRLPGRGISAIADKAGHWAYMYILARRHPASSTAIRARRKAKTTS